jgi:uncharacterized membrane protein YhfC
MVSNEALAGIALAILLSFGTPVAIYLICRKRMTLSWRNILLGVAVFVIFALVLEQLLHAFVLSSNPVTAMWMQRNPWGYVAYALAAAALFEEGGRYFGMRLLAKPTGVPGTGVAYGIGHGGIEAMLLGGLGQIQLLISGIVLNQGQFASISANLPPAVAAQLRHTLETLTLFAPLYGGIERVTALLFQIAFSLLVWKAVSERRVVFLFAAIAAHVALDVPAAMFQAGLMPLWQVQIAMIVALIALLGFFLIRLPRRIVPVPEAAI